MTCPNCGLENPDNAKFCSNCGTAFSGPAPQPSYQYQNPAPYQPPVPPRPGRSTGQKVAIGCLIAALIVILFGLSCTRACFGRRRYYRRYGMITVFHDAARLKTVPLAQGPVIARAHPATLEQLAG